jgi:hypothetical protein
MAAMHKTEQEKPQQRHKASFLFLVSAFIASGKKVVMRFAVWQAYLRQRIEKRGGVPPDALARPREVATLAGMPNSWIVMK